MDGEVASEETGLRFPPYYSGTDPGNCIVRVLATYTCLDGDSQCNDDPELAKTLCQTSCSNNEGCDVADVTPDHPMFGRLCGLLGASRPACSDEGLSSDGLRQLRATYQINMCMAPPGPPPSPPPPPAPAQPPEYYYI